MTDNKIKLDDEMLEEVVGGLFSWSRKKMTMTYSHPDGTTTVHKVLDLDKAWERSNILHSKKMNEDDILKDLISKGYIAG